jgi:hypothetical protein
VAVVPGVLLDDVQVVPTQRVGPPARVGDLGIQRDSGETLSDPLGLGSPAGEHLGHRHAVGRVEVVVRCIFGAVDRLGRLTEEFRESVAVDFGEVPDEAEQ